MGCVSDLLGDGDDQVASRAAQLLRALVAQNLTLRKSILQQIVDGVNEPRHSKSAAAALPAAAVAAAALAAPAAAALPAAALAAAALAAAALAAPAVALAALADAAAALAAPAVAAAVLFDFSFELLLIALAWMVVCLCPILSPLGVLHLLYLSLCFSVSSRWRCLCLSLSLFLSLQSHADLSLVGRRVLCLLGDS